MKRKRRKPDEKQRLVARVDSQFHAHVTKFSQALGISIQEFLTQALKAEMQGFDLRVQLKRTENQLQAVKERKDELVKQRNGFRLEVKQVAKCLGVPDTASHCIQRINEITQQLQTAEDTVSVVEADRDSYKHQRDCFKAKYEESQANLQIAAAKLRAYQQQGFWGRVFGREPVP